MSTVRVNPLKHDALTADTVKEGDRIICWKPGDPSSRIEYVLRSGIYPDEAEGGTLIVQVETNDGVQRTKNTDSVGLTGNRYTGEWSVIAILNEEADV